MGLGKNIGRLSVGFTLLVVLGVPTIHFLNRRQIEARLVRADPNTLPQIKELVAFAIPRGASLFEGRCANCHAVGGRGDPSRGVPELSDADWLYGSGQVSEIEKVVRYGIRANNPQSWNLAVMPAFGRPVPSKSEPQLLPLSPGDIEDNLEFLRTLSGKSADSAQAQRGSRIFSGRGACFDCHAVDAKGDTSIGAPNLTDQIWLYGDGSHDAIFDSIAYGRQGVCPAWVGKLTPAAVAEVSLYVYALSHRREMGLTSGDIHEFSQVERRPWR